MPRRQTAKLARAARPAAQVHAIASMPAAEALSFLRETRGVSTWTHREMAKSLKIGPADAIQVISILELQGYVKRSGNDEWMTTLSGESVAGSKAPRFTPERIEKALGDLRIRIAEINGDPHAQYEVTKAVAFGDFLTGRSRVQAAEIGMRLERRNDHDPESPEEHDAQRQFMRRLQGRGGTVYIRPYEDWMSARTHRRLL